MEMSLFKMNNENLNNNKEQKYIPECDYCGKPYISYYKKELVDNYTFGICYDENIEPDYTLIEDYKPACKCDFLHLSKEEKEKQILYNLAHSGLTPVLLEKSFDNLKLTEEQKKCREYAELLKDNKVKGIKLIGNVGTGKTVTLACICRYLIENGYKCYFTTLSDILKEYSKYSLDNAGKITGELEKLNKFDLIVLDDIGREKLTDTRKENLFSIIDYLINYKIKLAISCNENLFKKLKNNIKTNMPELEAVIDRLNELCPNVIYFNGPSFRGNI